MANTLKAKTTRDIPEHVAAKAAKAVYKRKLQALQAKTFEDLTAAEKDELLKIIAERSGLIKSSDDPKGKPKK